MNDREALKLALEALEEPKEHFAKHRRLEAITAIKEALAQHDSVQAKPEPEQEPVAWLWELTGEVTTDPDKADGMWLPLYTTPPQRTWIGLTDEDKQTAFDETQEGGGFWEFADAIEAKLKEKNT